jgi:hypothetical protein
LNGVTAFSYPLSSIIFLHGLLVWSIFPEDPAAEATAFDKSEVDARSIYVGNVSLFSVFSTYTEVIKHFHKGHSNIQ